mgnify:CR=1 FL=1
MRESVSVGDVTITVCDGELIVATDRRTLQTDELAITGKNVKVDCYNEQELFHTESVWDEVEVLPATDVVPPPDSSHASGRRRRQ